MFLFAILIAAIPLLIILGVAVSGRSRARRASAFTQTGTQARARMLSVQDTGTTINNNPRVRMEFAMLADGLAPWTIRQTATVSRVAIPRAGLLYRAFYDPADPQHVVIQLDQALPEPAAPAAPAGTSASPIEQLTALAALHKDGALTDAEFAMQKEKLLAGS